MRKDKRKTEIYAFRVSPEEKQQLMRAGEIMSAYSSTSDIVRDSALLTAGTIVAIRDGKLSPEEATKYIAQMLEDITRSVIPAGTVKPSFEIHLPGYEPKKAGGEKPSQDEESGE